MTLEIGRNRDDREVRNILKKFGQGAFCVTKADGQTFTGGADATVAFNTIDFDYNGWFNTSNYRYTPKTPGIYVFHAHILATANRANIAYIELWKNGAEKFHLDQMSQDRTLNGTCMVALDGVSDYITINCHPNVTDMTITSVAAENYLQGVLVSFNRS